ncbi:MAG TPA: pilus assembly protein TadG-related protein [Acetobacteraceae bacterium]|jgi:Flp pilus assembly protein TadG|nr:pilus assembly protein TadG-related protein [Acetobacteraceae bacterium]
MLRGQYFSADRRGAITVLMAVGASCLIGLAALAVETSNWYLLQAELQRVADSAAMAGALSYVKNNGCNLDATPVSCYQAAKDYAVMNGVAAENAATSLGASPSGDGNSAIIVTTNTNAPLMLSRIMSSNTSVAISATAYAEIQSVAPPCVEALSSSGSPDIKVTGTATLNGCSLWSKSNRVGTTQTTSSVGLSGNSTMTANVYTPGSVYVGGSSAFTGHRFAVTQAAIVDFIGAKAAVTTALNGIATVQGLAAPTMTQVNSGAQTWTGPVSGSCTLTMSGPHSYQSVTISAGTCSPFIVNLSGNFTIGSKNAVALSVTGNVVVNFAPATVTINGLIDLTGQTGGCFGLGTSGTTCAAGNVAGTYYVGNGGSGNKTSINGGAGLLTVGPGTFWSGGDVNLTGGGNVSWNTAGGGTDTTNVAGSVTLGTASYTFGAGVYQIGSDFNFSNSTGSLTFNGSSSASSLITIGGTSNGGGLVLGHNGASDTYSYSATSTTFILAQAPTLHGSGSGTHSLIAPCGQAVSGSCASGLSGSGIAGLLLAVPQNYTGTLNLPSENNGTVTAAGMIYGKAASLNLQGNVSVNGCFGFIVGTAVISGSASFSSCSALQGTAFSTVLAQ